MRLFPILLPLIGALACGGEKNAGGPEGPMAPVEPIPTTLALSETVVSLPLRGQFVEVTAIVRDQAGDPMADRPVEWSSGDASVASVEGGLITARSAGSTEVTATSGSLSASVDVSVAAAPWDISVGFESACALATDGSAHCWGSNIVGQLGAGVSGGKTNAPGAVTGGLVFASLSVGGRHACGLTDAGEAYCWGDNGNRQLGAGSGSSYIDTPQPVSGGHVFAFLTTGQYSTCGITTGEETLCWGSNWSGQIGNGDGGPAADTEEFPTPVSGSVEFVAVDAQGSHVCGRTDDGTGYCWGDDRYGTIGQGTWSEYSGPGPEYRPSPTVVDGLTFRSLVAGVLHTCGLTSSRTAHCWGYDAFGQLGTGAATSSAPFLEPSPQEVAGDLRLQSIDAGLHFTCGVDTGGTGYCWGANDEGQVGDGTVVPLPSGGRSHPTAVIGGLTFVAIDAGRRAACGVTAEAEVYCWGYGELGELGNGSYDDSPVPVFAMDLKR